MPNTTTDLFTTVKNVSGRELTFGFLGAHGVKLANNATYSVPGDLVTKLGSQRSQRQFKALERALTGNLLNIVKSPSVYLLSDTGNVTRELAMASTEELGTTVPSFDGGVGADLDFTEGDLNANDT
jgi:hypothetical protein